VALTWLAILHAAEVKLTAIDGATADQFGISVSISGDYAIVGARNDDDNGTDSGSAYSFLRSGGTWPQKDKQLASDGAAGDDFGVSVSISGDYAIVGAFNDDDNGSDSGSAYVYHFTDDLTLVELSLFTATSSADGVILRWGTEAEIDNAGFAIYRSDKEDGNYAKIAFVPGADNSEMSNDYQFTDTHVELGKTYFYYLEDVDLAGSKNKSEIIKVVISPTKLLLPIPTEFRLLQNYPNPFNPDTWLPYYLAADSSVVISIYDISGQLVRQLNLEKQEAGYYVTRDKSAYWDGGNERGQKVASGIYWYTLRAGEFNATKRMVILK